MALLAVRLLRRRAFLVLPLAVASCATGAPVGENFPALRYTYLPELKLNVASIEIENEWQPRGDVDHVESLAPETPLAALRQMAKDRLAAYGTSGKAIFVIEDASLVRQGSNVVGTFAVRLDVYSANGTTAGFAEARVSQTAHAPSGTGPPLREALYSLTRQLMNTMNVEFEFQLRRTLGEWLVSSAATPGTIEAAPLPGPGGNAAASVPGAPQAGPPASGVAPGLAPQPGVLGTLPVSPSPSQGPIPLIPKPISP
ncbi:MAG: hypothetical protein ACREFU_13765 [Acetobacteraceae bacterium]